MGRSVGGCSKATHRARGTRTHSRCLSTSRDTKERRDRAKKQVRGVLAVVVRCTPHLNVELHHLPQPALVAESSTQIVKGARRPPPHGIFPAAFGGAPFGFRVVCAPSTLSILGAAWARRTVPYSVTTAGRCAAVLGAAGVPGVRRKATHAFGLKSRGHRVRTRGDCPFFVLNKGTPAETHTAHRQTHTDTDTHTRRDGGVRDPQ